MISIFAQSRSNDEVNYIDGKINGLCQRWYNDGQLMEEYGNYY